MHPLKINAYFKGDIEKGEPKKFIIEWDEETADFMFKMEENKEFMYPVGIVLMDDEWVKVLFTGLYDKNKTEIWEGDIVESTWNLEKYIIEWDTRAGQWRFCPDCNTVDGALAGTKVISNKFLSPELIK